jgi:hypothetical protein
MFSWIVAKILAALGSDGDIWSTRPKREIKKRPYEKRLRERRARKKKG